MAKLSKGIKLWVITGSVCVFLFLMGLIVYLGLSTGNHSYTKEEKISFREAVNAFCYMKQKKSVTNCDTYTTAIDDINDVILQVECEAFNTNPKYKKSDIVENDVYDKAVTLSYYLMNHELIKFRINYEHNSEGNIEGFVQYGEDYLNFDCKKEYINDELQYNVYMKTTLLSIVIKAKSSKVYSLSEVISNTEKLVYDTVISDDEMKVNFSSGRDYEFIGSNKTIKVTYLKLEKLVTCYISCDIDGLNYIYDYKIDKPYDLARYDFGLHTKK